MNETTHLLLTKHHATDSNNDIQTIDNERKDKSVGIMKESRWLSIRDVLLSQRSINDIKRQQLLAGNIGTAAYLIRDAVLGDAYAVEDPTIGAYNPFSSSNSKNVLLNEISIICRKYCSSWTTLRVLHYSVALLILLTFFEPPHWCRNHRFNIISPDGQQQDIFLGGCDTVLRLSGIPKLDSDSNNTAKETETVEYYPNTATAVWLTVSQSHLLEILFLSTITIVIVLRFGRDGCSLPIYLRRSAGTTIQWNRICQILCIVTLFIGVYLEHITHDETFTTLHPYIRLVLFYTFLGGPQRDIQVLLGMLPVRFLYPFLH